jgi:hypothetical protein
MRLKYLFLIPLLALFGCATNPVGTPGPTASVTPIDASRLEVTKDLKYRTLSNGYFFPAGTYLPVARDDKGTYYLSPRGISVRTGITSYLHTSFGGIYVTHLTNGTQSFIAWYDEPTIRKTDVPLNDIGPEKTAFIIVRL